MTWIVTDKDGSPLPGTVVYTSNSLGLTGTLGNEFLIEQIQASPIVSNISFTMKSSIDGYSINCEDQDGQNTRETCMISVAGIYSNYIAFGTYSYYA